MAVIQIVIFSKGLWENMTSEMADVIFPDNPSNSVLGRYKILQNSQKLHLDFLLTINYDVVDIKDALKSVPVPGRKNRCGAKCIEKKAIPQRK